MSVERRRYSEERRKRLLRRALPVTAGLAVLILVITLLVTGGASPAVTGARRFVAAWERSDYSAMRALITPEAQRRYAFPAFQRAYRAAAGTATATGVAAIGKVRDAPGGAAVPLEFRTRLFGTLTGRLGLPMAGSRVKWSPELVFPGLQPGQILNRRSDPPRRAAILARDGRTIVSGSATARVPSGAGSAISGGTGPAATVAERDALYARGFPRDWPVGHGGLEAILETQVAGRPGGTLYAGTRRVASAAPRPAHAVRTTIDLGLESSAQSALAGRVGGIAVLDPRTAEVRALAGIAFSAPQPPGSTFKLITLSAVLEGHIAKPTTPFPVSSYAVIDGVKLSNANGESCGVNVAEGFVQSCNSVYAPLGVRVGARRLVAMAERYGWNTRPPFAGARPSTIPAADQMMVAQTIASGGLERTPTIMPGPLTPPRRVLSIHTAHTIRKLMVAVVARGTGVSAALGTGVVAGKTGTAELESTTGPSATPADKRTHTDAWFTSFAPARSPRIVVAVMLYRAGAGGDVAAPTARQVLAAGLARR
ncbi:MAG: hypothetical protein E6G07_04105 [Actinobacteria bacterium]|nr:MAG: hypothetical protein E6G07_04105 [Actinomycetota bacterium]